MPGADELTSFISGGSRAILIAEKDVDLRSGPFDNRLLVLLIGEGSTAAGGRGGGFGERKVTRVAVFQARNGEWSKAYETEDESKVAEFEVPYYVSRIPMTLPDGTESMGYGVVDPDLVAQLIRKTASPSPS